jgi:hypothetical protein
VRCPQRSTGSKLPRDLDRRPSTTRRRLVDTALAMARRRRWLIPSVAVGAVVIALGFAVLLAMAVDYYYVHCEKSAREQMQPVWTEASLSIGDLTESSGLVSDCDSGGEPYYIVHTVPTTSYEIVYGRLLSRGWKPLHNGARPNGNRHSTFEEKYSGGRIRASVTERDIGEESPVEIHLYRG